MSNKKRTSTYILSTRVQSSARKKSTIRSSPSSSLSSSLSSRSFLTSTKDDELKQILVKNTINTDCRGPSQKGGYFGCPFPNSLSIYKSRIYGFLCGRCAILEDDFRVAIRMVTRKQLEYSYMLSSFLRRFVIHDRFKQHLQQQQQEQQNVTCMTEIKEVEESSETFHHSISLLQVYNAQLSIECKPDDLASVLSVLPMVLIQLIIEYCPRIPPAESECQRHYVEHLGNENLSRYLGNGDDSIQFVHLSIGVLHLQSKYLGSRFENEWIMYQMDHTPIREITSGCCCIFVMFWDNLPPKMKVISIDQQTTLYEVKQRLRRYYPNPCLIEGSYRFRFNGSKGTEYLRTEDNHQLLRYWGIEDMSTLYVH